MSRCFPFPPPGYAKKTRVEDNDLLAKEKQKEKKHKKEKKERSSKEGKEKKEKDRTKQKHKDKKDRKEKHKDKDKHKEKGQKPDKKDPELSTISRNGEKLCQNSLQTLEPKDSKHVQELEKRVQIGPNSLQQHEIKDSLHVQELEKRIKYDDGASRSQSSEISTAQPVSSDDQKTKTHAVIPEFFTTEKPQMGKISEKSFHKQNGKESHVVKTEEIPQFSTSESKKSEQEKKSKDKDQIKANSLDFRNAKPSNCTVVNSSNVDDTHVGKRKEIERNGYLFDDEIRLKKSAKLCNEIESKTGDHVRIDNHGIPSKDPKVNGFISPHRRNEIPAKIPAAPKDNGESSERVKSPHPDCKYLTQIFSVPVVDELPESLDQDWLFSDKKTKTLTPTTDVEIEEVWSEAVRIESADITALPYVIPY